MPKHAGHCLCGQTRWSYDGQQTWACYCHCESCRRNCAAPVVGFIGVRLADFTWMGQGTGQYESSNGVTRHFCTSCGTPMAFQAAHYEGEIHLYASALENPFDFNPAFHVHYDEKLPWLALHDDLPKYGKSKP